MNSDVVIGDWGSTRLRLWRLADGEVAERREGAGIANTIDPAGELLKTLGDWQAERVILCGMAGARGGLCEVPYLPCPVSPSDWTGAATAIGLDERRIAIAVGLSCRSLPGRPDVMRGEEAHVFGAMALDADLAAGTHWLVLPGTHSKWVRVKDGSITGFRTFMTGELFALLGRSSLVVQGAADGDDDRAGFAAGLARAREGGGLSGNLFEARSVQLVDSKSPTWARGFVSGLLIGTEVAEMAPQGVIPVIGEPGLAVRYAEALAQAGAEARQLDGEACAIAGLRLLDDN